MNALSLSRQESNESDLTPGDQVNMIRGQIWLGQVE